MIVEMQGRDDADQAARRADLAALRNGPARQYSLRVFFAGEPGFFGAGDYRVLPAPARCVAGPAMTIGGFIVDGGRALMWCDSEKYTDTEPDGEFSKLAVQALGPIAATGCGTVAMLMQVVEDLHRVRSIDGAASILKKTKRTDGGEIGAVGYSPRYLRMLGYHFSGENGSAGQLCPHAAWPKVDATSLHAVGERRDLVGIALGQMTTLRRLTNRLASGHTLVVAELTCHAIAIERIPISARWRPRSTSRRPFVPMIFRPSPAR